MARKARREVEREFADYLIDQVVAPKLPEGEKARRCKELAERAWTFLESRRGGGPVDISSRCKQRRVPKLSAS